MGEPEKYPGYCTGWSRERTMQGRGPISMEQTAEISPKTQQPKRRQATPAFKLLVYLMYTGGTSCLRVSQGRDYIYITSFRTLARLMGTSVTASVIRKWLVFLEDRGYIDSVVFSENLRQAKVRLRPPRNVGALRV